MKILAQESSLLGKMVKSAKESAPEAIAPQSQMPISKGQSLDGHVLADAPRVFQKHLSKTQGKAQSRFAKEIAA